MSSQNHSSPLRSCFRGKPTTTTATATATSAKNRSSSALPPSVSSNPNLTTCLYQTELGLFALTWSRNLFGCSLHLHLLLNGGDNNHSPSSLSTPCFTLHIKPFIFWSKHGSKKLNLNTNTTKNACVYWDLTKAKFGSWPEPQSGFYIAVVINGEIILLIGDSPREAYGKTKAKKPENIQSMVLRREHVYGNKLYTTKAKFGGKERNISIDCRIGDDPRLNITVDSKRVLKIKHLKWKFRGNERIEIDGVNVQVSWDVYNWLFDDNNEDGYALFMFKFEDEYDNNSNNNNNNNSMVLHSQQSFGLGFETKKMKKGLLRSGRSSSSSSLSSASSSCSSVMEWACMEENELKAPAGFSLMVYAWKS